MRVLANILSEQACAEMVITGQCRPCAVSSAAGKCSRESDGGPGPMFDGFVRRAMT